MAKDKKLKPELASGFVDRKGEELILKDRLIEIIKRNFRLFGFEPLETPGFEISENIGKFLPDEDRPMSGVFGFKDKNEWMSLRYDLTAPLARYVAKNFDSLPKPFKRYQVGNVWRNEKPGPGRFREFTQIDADIIGTKNLNADAEMCNLVADTLIKCGLKKDEFIIKINNRKIFQGILAFFNITDPKQSLTVLRSIDKFQSVGKKGVLELLTKGRLDKSGDFTPGAKLKKETAKDIFELMSAGSIVKSNGKYRLTGGDSIFKIENKLYLEGLKELEAIFNYLENIKDFNVAGTDFQRKENKINIQLDFSVVRGLEYYTGPIFEIETFETDFWKNAPDDQKAYKKIKIGSIGGGGRYDNLVSRFTNQSCPATGVSIGLDRLLLFLLSKEDKKTSNNPIIICVFDNKNINEYNKLLQILRTNNVNSEVYMGDGNLKSQLKYADKRNSPAAILYGDDEIKAGEVTIKNLSKGKETSKKIKTRDDWKSGESSQIKVKIEEMVNEIKKII